MIKPNTYIRTSDIKDTEQFNQIIDKFISFGYSGYCLDKDFCGSLANMWSNFERVGIHRDGYIDVEHSHYLDMPNEITPEELLSYKTPTIQDLVKRVMQLEYRLDNLSNI